MVIQRNTATDGKQLQQKNKHNNRVVTLYRSNYK
jgi:hypothetical protein